MARYRSSLPEPKKRSQANDNPSHKNCIICYTNINKYLRIIIVSKLQNEYEPDSVSAPGETLLETLETLGMSQEELATRMGRPVKTINEIIQKRAAITAETALQLEQVLHIPASFWLKREQNYRESLARLSQEQQRKNSA